MCMYCYCLPAGTLCGWPMDAHTPTAAIMVAGGVEVFPFEVPTVAEGQNGGRRYQFMADSSELQDHWVKTLRSLAQAAKEKHEEEAKLTPWQQIKARARGMHDSLHFQALLGAIVTMSVGSVSACMCVYMWVVCGGFCCVKIIVIFV